MKTENILLGITVVALTGAVLGAALKPRHKFGPEEEFIDFDDSFQKDLEEELYNSDRLDDEQELDLVDFSIRGQIPFMVG